MYEFETIHQETHILWGVSCVLRPFALLNNNFFCFIYILDFCMLVIIRKRISLYMCIYMYISMCIYPYISNILYRKHLPFFSLSVVEYSQDNYPSIQSSLFVYTQWPTTHYTHQCTELFSPLLFSTFHLCLKQSSLHHIRAQLLETPSSLQ